MCNFQRCFYKFGCISVSHGNILRSQKSHEVLRGKCDITRNISYSFRSIICNVCQQVVNNCFSFVSKINTYRRIHIRLLSKILDYRNNCNCQLYFHSFQYTYAYPMHIRQCLKYKINRLNSTQVNWTLKISLHRWR